MQVQTRWILVMLSIIAHTWWKISNSSKKTTLQNMQIVTVSSVGHELTQMSLNSRVKTVIVSCEFISVWIVNLWLQIHNKSTNLLSTGWPQQTSNWTELVISDYCCQYRIVLISHRSRSVVSNATQIYRSLTQWVKLWDICPKKTPTLTVHQK